MKDKKHEHAPKTSSNKLDGLQGGAKDKHTKTGQTNALMKEKELIQRISLRLPAGLYKKLREYAFKNNEKMNQIIVRLVGEHFNGKKF